MDLFLSAESAVTSYRVEKKAKRNQPVGSCEAMGRKKGEKSWKRQVGWGNEFI